MRLKLRDNESVLKGAAKARLALAATLLLVSWLGYFRVNSRFLLQVGEELKHAHDETLSPEDEAFLDETLVKKKRSAKAPLGPPDDNGLITAELPIWMQKYAAWHQEARAKLNETNWNSGSHRYLVMIARRDRQCGGLTDRLKPLPSFLKLAAKTNRILMIYWEKPFALEHYLLPPEGGLDWRVPFYMVDTLFDKRTKIAGRQADIRRHAHSNNMITSTTMQALDYAEEWYDTTPLEGDGNNTIGAERIAMFRHMWNWVFTPAPPIAQRIKDNFDKLGLVPGEYASAHIRAVYAVKDRPKWRMIQMTQNAMNCISKLRPGGPFFVASDTAFAVETAIKYGRSKNVTVVATTNNGAYQKQPLHLDMYNMSDTSIVPEDFYDAFVDLYLLGSTRCVTHGQGSFGHWGYLLGYNSTCEIRHFKGPICHWTDPPATNATTDEDGTDSSEQKMSRPLFRRPMSYDSIYSFYR